ncbi:MAG: tRNA (adenosine(37)-N6)-threonylcarbamoyltransferase complex transferase subunit TsaD [Flavobacteriales bacterium]
MKISPRILAIESSCDDTSAAVLEGNRVLSNVIAGQKVHEKFGGVVPELASRAHQANIVPVVRQALLEANIQKVELDAIAFTQGPGLLGSLLVGGSFAKSMSAALQIPLIAVHHMQAHILSHFIDGNNLNGFPDFPFLCLTVSGGHTQIVIVYNPYRMEIVGETIDDAAGEAFDKAAKVMGLPYPGGPMIDKLASEGDASKYKFTTPRIAEFDFSFSGLKTNLLYFLKEQNDRDSSFIEREKKHICASYQSTIVKYLMQKLEAAAVHYGVTNIGLAGGVSANSLLRSSFQELADRRGWKAFIPPFVYCTDNAAMIGIAAYYKFIVADLASESTVPSARMEWKSF